MVEAAGLRHAFEFVLVCLLFGIFLLDLKVLIHLLLSLCKFLWINELLSCINQVTEIIVTDTAFPLRKMCKDCNEIALCKSNVQTLQAK